MSDEGRPSFVPIWLQCKSCRHAWDDWQPVGVTVATWIAHVKSFRCPHCGAGGRNVLHRSKPLDEVPP